MLRRNPRRAYEKDGSEIPPMTLVNMRENGTRSIEATCTECQHAATMNVDHLDGAVPVPDVALALRLRCSSCGARAEGIYIRPNWSERKAGPGGLHPHATC
jgi:ribosomal protein L44E